jgi:transcription elongation factor Elf1
MTTRRSATTTATGRRSTRAPRDWECLECGHLMTFATAERCAFRAGCPRCGGVDIDLAIEAQGGLGGAR